MNGTQALAARVLTAEWDFLLPVGYAAWRLLALPHMAAAADDTPVSIMDQTEPEVPDYVRAGKFVFLCLSLMFLGDFVLTTGGDIHVVAEGHVIWGSLVALLAVGMVAMIGAVEWLHLQDNRYVDLLLASDEKTTKMSAQKYQSVSSGLRISGVVWVGLFVMVTLWLWEISRTTS